ncbi:FkbM family methyltransferase [Brucella sp. 6810]|uniref:FkbM family methyltransferase n=1 Tax=Brucella sp. 6810 TaxID=2769351 RepID=UPI00165CBE80|nr:FkbM family methyltransferase [Brucella sp. 6810]QNQ62037.1 FkbM family methyltransferase [Brucella sp. 6810]
MMFISYAQNFEDVILWRALKHIENGFYVDIGAQDPVVDSVSRGFYERGWRGVSVEPTATYVGKLRENRPDEEIFQVAIGNGGENIRFFEIPDTGLSTGDAEIAEEHRQHGFDVIETKAPLVPLSAIFDRIGNRDIHWLKIDVEGMEKSVIESWSPSEQRPWVVVVESTHPLRQDIVFEDWDSLLSGRGYEFVYFDGLNRFYISDEHSELKSFFGVGPNVFDDFAVSGYANSPLATILLERIKLSEDRISTFKERLEVLQAEKDELYRRNAHHAYIANSVQLELTRVYSSLSWKMTSPLRWIKSQVIWFFRGTSAWLKMKHGSRPRRAIYSFMTHAMLWIRQRPRVFAFALKIIHLLPPLERRIFSSAHARGLGLSYRVRSTVVDPNWQTDVERDIYDKWKMLLK